MGCFSVNDDWRLVEGHALHDLTREKHADSLCRETLECLRRARPTPFPANLLTDFVEPSDIHVAPTREDVMELTDKRALFEASDR